MQKEIERIRAFRDSLRQMADFYENLAKDVLTPLSMHSRYITKSTTYENVLEALDIVADEEGWWKVED